MLLHIQRVSGYGIEHGAADMHVRIERLNKFVVGSPEWHFGTRTQLPGDAWNWPLPGWWSPVEDTPHEIPEQAHIEVADSILTVVR